MRPVGFLLSLSLATAVVVCQRPVVAHHPDSPNDEPLVPIHTADPDQGLAYGIWAAGPGYKVAFHDGATFVPLLGRDYPHNQPWTWHTSSVTVGGQELVAQAPRLSYDGLRAEYDLGGVVEAYDVRAEGVEQTFVLRRRPAGLGDLVIRGVVTSLLHAGNLAPAQQAVRFFDDRGRHLVTYGAVTAVDADGRWRAMTTAHENGEITLRLDGAWLAEAAYPVVIDPLLGPGTQSFGSTRDEIDVVRASEGASDAIWMGYSVWASATDRDVFLRRYDDSGLAGALVYSDISASWSSQGAKVAYVAGADRAVIVFDRLLALNGSRRLRFHSHLRTDSVANTSVTFIGSTDSAWRADVGGTEIGSSTEALVVWQQESNGTAWQETSSSSIHGCFIDLATSGVGAPFQISAGPLTDQERPSVTQTSRGTANNSWLVAYQTVNTFTIGGVDDWDVGVREVDSVGNVSAPFYPDNGSADHKFAPIIEGQGGRYLVAFGATPTTSAFPTGVASEQLRVTRIDWPIGGVGIGPWGTVVLQANNDARIELGGLGYDRDTANHWAILFRSNVTERLYLRTVGYRGQQLQAETVLIPPAGDESVAGGISYSDLANQFVIGYGVNGGSNYVTIERFVHPSVAVWSATGVACSAATIEWSGPQLIGTESGRVRVVGAANDSIHVLGLATAPASLQLFGVGPIQNGCWLLIPSAGPDYLGIVDLAIGADPQWGLPLPELLDTDTYYFQDFHTIGNGNFDFVSTQRLELPVVK